MQIFTPCTDVTDDLCLELLIKTNTYWRLSGDTSISYRERKEPFAEKLSDNFDCALSFKIQPEKSKSAYQTVKTRKNVKSIKDQMQILIENVIIKYGFER